jgi:hypothetical protein
MLLRALVILAILAPQEKKSVDLLKLVDPAKDAVAGTWAFEETTLVASTVKFGRLQIPYAPPAEYDVRLVVERKAGANSVVLGLVAQGRQFVAVVDAFEKDPFSGIELIDGKAFPDNATGVPGRHLENGKKATLEYGVRKDRVTMAVNGKKIVDWKADWEGLSLYKDWKMPRADALFLGAWTAPYHIHEATLTPVSGEGKPLR